MTDVTLVHLVVEFSALGSLAASVDVVDCDEGECWGVGSEGASRSRLFPALFWLTLSCLSSLVVSLT